MILVYMYICMYTSAKTTFFSTVSRTCKPEKGYFEDMKFSLCDIF